MSSNPTQLLLLADHINLSLLERQRAISLNLQPNSHDGEISRSLDSLNNGIERLEDDTSQTNTDQLLRLRRQYETLYSQFTGTKPLPRTPATPNSASLVSDFSDAQTRPQTKSVRFSDNAASAENANRAALLPYRDDPDDDPDHTALDNQQIHEYHSRVIQEQDDQLDRLGESIGRQREISIRIGDELDEQMDMIDDVDEGVDRHQSALERAQGRLGKIAKRAKDNMQLTVIFILIIILVLLIVVLK